MPARSPLRSTFYAGAVLLIVFGAAEGLARLGEPPPNLGACRGLYQDHPTRGFGLIPGQVVGDFRINSWGARGPERSPASSCHRILVLGDSFTLGAGGEADTFHAVLQELIRLRSPPGAACVEVIGAGVSGYGTRHQRLWFDELAPALHPDEVILQFFVGNDFEDSSAPPPDLVCGWPQPPGQPATLQQRSRAAVCRSWFVARSTHLASRIAFSPAPGRVPALGTPGFAELCRACDSAHPPAGCEAWIAGGRPDRRSIEFHDPAGLYADSPALAGVAPTWLDPPPVLSASDPPASGPSAPVALASAPPPVLRASDPAASGPFAPVALASAPPPVLPASGPSAPVAPASDPPSSHPPAPAPPTSVPPASVRPAPVLPASGPSAPAPPTSVPPASVRPAPVGAASDPPSGMRTTAPPTSACLPLARLASARGMEQLRGSGKALPADQYVAATAKGLRILSADLNGEPWASRLASTRQELDRFAAAVLASGADLSLLVMPGEVQVVDSVRAAAWRLAPSEQLPDPADLDLDWPQRWLADWAGLAGVPLIDPTADLRDASRTALPYLPYNHHLNPWGDWVVAEALWSWWAPANLPAPAPPGCGPPGVRATVPDIKPGAYPSAREPR